MLLGSPYNLGAVTVTGSIRLSGGVEMVINGIGITTTSGPGFSTQDGGTELEFLNVVFYDCATDHWGGNRYSAIKAIGNYTIAGNAQRHMSAAMGQAQVNPGVFITIQGTPTFSGYFALATELGFIDYGGTVVGTPYTAVHAKQYGESLGGGIYVSAGDPRLPGDQPGYAGPPMGNPY